MLAKAISEMKHSFRRCTVGVLTVLGAILAVAAAGCGSDEPAPAPDHSAWDGTITTEGETTIVRTLSGSVWRSARLVEEASIGTADGEDPYVFSQIRSIAADAERIYVVDTLANAVRVYDAAGNYLMDLGRPGDGPGELRRPWAVGIVGDSRILVRDRAQGRVHAFSPEGEFLGDFRVSGAARTTISAGGTVYVHGWIPGLEDGSGGWGCCRRGRRGAATPSRSRSSIVWETSCPWIAG